jgi:hypothetical protein
MLITISLTFKRSATMKLIRSFFISSLLLAVIFITGCNEGPTTSSELIGTSQQVSKFSLPQGQTVSSAMMYIYVGGYNSTTVNIYGVSSDWTETGVTWSNKPTIFSTVEGSFSPTANGWKAIDITGLVNKWLNGSYANFGLLLDQVETNQTYSNYISKEGEGGAYAPYVRVEYAGGTAIVADIADADIWENYPLNLGNETSLYTGYINGLEKQTLIKFDFEYVPEVECETAFAFDGDNLTTTIGTCFSEYGFDRWGWSIYLPGTGTYTFPVYAGAGQCDITKGTYVGDVTVVYAVDGTVTFTYDFEEGFSASEEHFYAGKTTVARDNKGNPTVAPGQYKVTPNLTGGIYIIAHAVVCSSDWD